MRKSKIFKVKLDAGAIIIDFNTHAAELSGYAPEEVIGKNWFKLFIEDDDLVSVLKVFESIFLGKNFHWNYTNDILTKSGDNLTLHWENEIIMDENGKRLYVLAKGKQQTV